MAFSPIDPGASGYDYALVPPAGASRDSAQAPQVAAQARAQPQQFVGNDQASPAATPRPVEYSAGSRSADGGPGREQPDQAGREPGLVVSLSTEGKQASATYQAFTPQEQAQLNQLKQRDREVRTHEQAHKAAGGRYVRGGARYEYQSGPDGRQYAVGGEVSIDASPASTPQATIGKAQTVRRAALAPAQPSGADRQVAAKASQMESEARTELAREKAEQAELAAERKGQDIVPAAASASPAPAAPAAPGARPLSVYI